MSRDATATYTYKGVSNTLLSGVLKAIEKMNLTITHESVNDDSFSFEVSEKRKWLSTNWPIKFKIESSFMNGASIMIIKASPTLTLYRRASPNQAKINEFLAIVKISLPDINKSNESGIR